MTGRRRHRIVTPLLLVLIAALLALQQIAPWDDEAPSHAPWPVDSARADLSPLIGVTTLSLARNSATAWDEADLVEVNAFEQLARRHADIVTWFVDWERGRFDPHQAELIRARGSIPELVWEPWDSRVGPRQPQRRYQLKRIIDGTHDAVVREFAQAVARYGRRVRIRFAQEMNGDAYPWAERVNGNRPGEYVRAWRHVHAIFRREGAVNVDWIWAPVVGDLDRRQFPGRRFVDVLGASGFNGGMAAFGGRWRPFEEIFGPTLDELHALAPRKPLSLVEIASAEAGGDKALWIREMFAALDRRPYVEALVWFELDKEADWPIASSDAAARAFAAGVGTRGR